MSADLTERFEFSRAGKQVGIVCSLLLAAACTPPTPNAAAPALGDSAYVSLVGASSAVFIGTVVVRPGRTTDAVPLTPFTAVVRVDSLVNWGRAIDIAPGESVTVVLRDTAHPSLNTRYAFLGNGIAVDSGIVLEETARYLADSTVQIDSFVAAYDVAVSRSLDRETHDHLSEIGLVAWGPITGDTAPVLSAEVARRNRSESDPQWRVATFVPRRVLRGDTTLASQPLRVLYPSSRHIIYALVPRLRIGDLRIYLLHRPSQIALASFAGIDTAGAFVVFDSFDVRPLGDTTRVVNLLTQRP